MYYKKNYNKKNANKLFFSYLIAYVEFFMARLYGFLFLFLFMNDYMGLWTYGDWCVCDEWVWRQQCGWDVIPLRKEKRRGGEIKIIKMKSNS